MAKFPDASLYYLADAAARLGMSADQLLQHAIEERIRIAARFKTALVEVILHNEKVTEHGTCRNGHHPASREELAAHGILLPEISGLCYLNANTIDQIAIDGHALVSWVAEVTPSKPWPENSHLKLCKPVTRSQSDLVVPLTELRRIESEGSKDNTTEGRPDDLKPKSAQPKTKPNKQRRLGPMAEMIEEAFKELQSDPLPPTPAAIMRHLQSRAGDGGCIIEAVPEGVKWNYGGKRKTLDMAALTKRLDRRKKRLTEDQGDR